MINTKQLRQALDKFLKGEVAANARVQVVLPNGEYYDITEIKLMQNRLLGVRETHRMVITIDKEKWRMGKVIKKGLVTLKPENKFYKEIKKNFKDFQLTRIENLSVPGVPDLLCYNKNHFFLH